MQGAECSKNIDCGIAGLCILGTCQKKPWWFEEKCNTGDSYSCVECKDDSDCESGTCEFPGYCRFTCNDDADCGEPLVCDDGTCGVCKEHVDCENEAGKPYCVEGYCE